MVVNSDIIFIAMDNNKSRIECEKLCAEFQKDYLSAGVGIDKGKGIAFYECTWKPETPREVEDDEGYGPENGSFSSIVLEATAVCFNLMLHHMQNNGERDHKHCEKEYLNFRPKLKTSLKELICNLLTMR